MARLFETWDVPPFPSDVQVATLQHVSLASLIADDAQESENLFNACTSTGFFLLNLKYHIAGVELLKAATPIFGLAENLFKLPLEQKDAYSFKAGEPMFGYKGYGVAKVDAKGTPDRCEFWAIAKDDISSISEPRPNPGCIHDQRPALREFITQSHGLVDVISSHLDKGLGLPKGTLASKQNLQARSGNQVRMIKTPPQPPADSRTSLVPHTDIGAITVLFNVLGGLQILPPGKDASVERHWQFVKPEAGCVIINIGDAMVQWTNGILRSNMHRVAYPPGEQGRLTRYSVAYFARPVSDARMVPLKQSKLVQQLIAAQQTNVDGDEEALTAEEWKRRKGIALRFGNKAPQSAGGISQANLLKFRIVEAEA